MQIHSPARLLGPIVAVAALAASPLAQAYFVRPYAQLGAVVQDGLEQNNSTVGVVNIGGLAKAAVDLNDASTHNYLQVSGPGGFGAVAGVFGDRLTFQGAADSIQFTFDFDGHITSDVGKLGTEALQVGLTANLRVYDAGAGANYNNFTTLPGALVSDARNLDFSDPAVALDEFVNESMAGSYSFLGGTQTVDVFFSLSIFTATNNNPIEVTMDFFNTGVGGVQTGPGVLYASQSAVFPGSTVLPSVPEPGITVLLLAGLGVVGGLVRVRRAA